MEALDVKLQEIIDVLFKMGITLYDFQPESSEVMFDRMYVDGSDCFLPSWQKCFIHFTETITHDY